MAISRRNFLVTGSLAVLDSACARSRGTLASATGTLTPALVDEVLERALRAAIRAGAAYADVRVVRRRGEQLLTKDDHVVSVSDWESYGVGVRVLAAGAWGFSASSLVTGVDAERAAARAVAMAKENARLQSIPVELAPVKAYRAAWATPLARDPFAVTLSDKARMLLDVWPQVKAVPRARYLNASAESYGEYKVFASTEGSHIQQAIVRVGAGYEVTAIDPASGRFATRAHELPPRQAGWEYVEDAPFARQGRAIAEDADAKLMARSVEPGPRDLVLAPSNLWLTIHESVGHPTELDRVMGDEANFAGTSFATPDERGKLRYASPLVTIYADKTTAGGLATCGFDDDGVETQRWDLVKDGLFVGYQTTREQASWIGEASSRGTSYAEDFKSFPFQRMPNVSLAPGPSPRGIDDLVAATEDGIYVTGNGSSSIDQQRYNFQFGGQMFYEIKHGKIAGPLRDVAYQSNSVDFWNRCDMIGGREAWELHGTLNDGKGEPTQSNPVSHGCPPARFRGVNVLNTGDGGQARSAKAMKPVAS